MTRAIDRLLVSGRGRVTGETTPIGWVLSKLDCDAELGGEQAAVRARARRCLIPRPGRPGSRGDRRSPASPRRPSGAALALRRACPSRRRRPRLRLPELAPVPGPALHRVRQLSVLGPRALRALLVPLLRRTGRRACASGRHEQERGGAARGDRDRRRGPPAARGSSTRQTRGRPTWRSSRLVSGRERGRARTDRRASFAPTATRRSPPACRARRTSRPERPFAFVHDGVLLRGRARRPPARRRARSRRSTSRRTSSASAPPTRWSSPTTGSSVSSTPWPASAQVRRRSRSCTRSSSARTGRSSRRSSSRGRRAGSGALGGDRPDRRRRLHAEPRQFTCAGCPALDVVCAGPEAARAAARRPALEPAGLAARPARRGLPQARSARGTGPVRASVGSGCRELRPRGTPAGRCRRASASAP